MLVRALVLAAASIGLIACVDSERLRSNLGAPPAAASEVQLDPAKQTLATKVLGAIALERVTKRKPDPARLNELR